MFKGLLLARIRVKYWMAAKHSLAERENFLTTKKSSEFFKFEDLDHKNHQSV